MDHMIEEQLEVDMALEESTDQQVENDEIDAREAAFIQGYEDAI